MRPITPLLRALILFGVTLVVPAVQVGAQTLYSHGDPNPQEQFILELINRDRADPPAAGRRLVAGPDPLSVINGYPDDPFPTSRQLQAEAQLASYPSRPPVAFTPILLGLARVHSLRMGELGDGFDTDTDGSTAQSRARAAGYPYTVTGEIGFVRSGGPAAQHSVNLMGSDFPGPVYRNLILEPVGLVPCREVGVGYLSGFRYGQSAITEEFGRRLDGPALLVGVAYQDRDGDGFYTPGEGLGGIVVSAPQASSFYTVTSASGGYTLPLDRLPAYAFFEAETRVVFAEAGTGRTISARQQPLHANSFAGAHENTKADYVLGAQGQPIIQPYESFLVAGPKVFAPTVSVTVLRSPGPPGTTGPGAKGKLAVTRSLDPGAPDGGLSLPLTVRYAVSGSAKPDVHYRALSGEVTIAAGQITAKVTVLPLTASHRARTVVLTLQPPTENDAPYVPAAGEGAAATMILPSSP